MHGRAAGDMIGVCFPKSPPFVKTSLSVALLLALALPGAVVHAAPARTSAPAALAVQDADAQFKAIYAKEWAWRQAGGGEASEDEDAPANATRLPDVGPEAQAARLKVWDEVLQQLKTIDPATLSAENQVNYAIYKY